jgi:hypothetical protein
MLDFKDCFVTKKPTIKMAKGGAKNIALRDLVQKGLSK